MNLVKSCNRENLNIALKDPSTLVVIKKYREYEDNVHNGHLGKTGTFWFSFIEHCHLLYMRQYSVKTNNFELFALIIDSSISRLLGEEWSVKPEVQEQLEQFTCIMYGHAQETLISEQCANKDSPKNDWRGQEADC